MPTFSLHTGHRRSDTLAEAAAHYLLEVVTSHNLSSFLVFLFILFITVTVNLQSKELS